MAFEKNTILNIKSKFEENFSPTVWWEHGTLWADCDEKESIIIKDALEECLSSGFKVGVSLLKATKTEPWDQYAFDIMTIN